MKTIATIAHNDNARTDRVSIAYDPEQRILVARAADEDWYDAGCGIMDECDATTRVEQAWGGFVWDLQFTN